MQGKLAKEREKANNDGFPIVSFNVSDSSLDEITRYLAKETGVSFVTQGNRDSSAITLVIDKKPLDVVVELIARRIGSAWTYNDGVFFIGDRERGDDSTLVRRVLGQSRADLESILLTIQAENVYVSDDGLCIINGEPRTIEKINGILDRIEDQSPNLWAIQIYVISMTDSDALRFGLDTKPALDAAITYASGSAAGLDVEASFNALLEAEDDINSVQTVVRPVFLMLDGEKSTFDRVTRFPIQRAVVSETGIVNRTGVEYQEAGTTIEVEIRQMKADAVRMDLSLELSSPTVTNRDGFPTFESRRYSNPCVCYHNGVYLLTTIDLETESRGKSTSLRFGQRFNGTKEVLQVFARVSRVEGVQQYQFKDE